MRRLLLLFYQFMAHEGRIAEHDQIGPMLFVYLRARRHRRGGSRPGRSRNVERLYHLGHRRIFEDYFAESSTYTEETFTRRYRMERDIFDRIYAAVSTEDYFVQKPDAAGRLGFSPLQKITAALRVLAYGCSADSLDEYVRMAESTVLKCLVNFCDAVSAHFKDEYLRQPREDDLERLLKVADVGILS